jgi:hypothetical protein
MYNEWGNRRVAGAFLYPLYVFSRVYLSFLTVMQFVDCQRKLKRMHQTFAWVTYYLIKYWIIEWVKKKSEKGDLSHAKVYWNGLVAWITWLCEGNNDDLMEHDAYQCVNGMYFQIFGEITFQPECRCDFWMKTKCGCVLSFWLNGFSCFSVCKSCCISSRFTLTLLSVDGRPLLREWNYLLFYSRLLNIRAQRQQLFWHIIELLRGCDGNENPGPGRPCINELFILRLEGSFAYLSSDQRRRI